MDIRKATTEDIKTLTHRLARNQKSWATVSHMKNDIICGYLWLLEDEKQYCGILRDYSDFLWLVRREAYDNIQ